MAIIAPVDRELPCVLVEGSAALVCAIEAGSEVEDEDIDDVTKESEETGRGPEVETAPPKTVDVDDSIVSESVMLATERELSIVLGPCIEPYSVRRTTNETCGFLPEYEVTTASPFVVFPHPY